MYNLSEVDWKDSKGQTIDDPLATYITNERLRYETADESFRDALDNLITWEDECLTQ